MQKVYQAAAVGQAECWKNKKKKQKNAQNIAAKKSINLG